MAPDAEKKKPGPEADRLKLDEDEWGDAVKKALDKERPETGWPKADQPADDQNDPED